MKSILPVKILAAGILLLAAVSLAAADPAANSADTAWNELQKAAELPQPPAAWRTNQPTDDQIAKFYAQANQAAEIAAAKARAFYTEYSKSTNAPVAKLLASQILEAAFYTSNGDTNALADWGQAQAMALADPRLTDDERFTLRTKIIRQKAVAQQINTPGSPVEKYAAYCRETETCLRRLIKDYPHRERAYVLWLNLAANSPEADARRLVQEALGFDLPPPVKAQAEGILTRLDGLGKPLDIKFTAVDGRQVDLSQMKGKVVLVDFWATWCGPCVGELPNVKAAYDKFHAKGFEIVGISFDGDKDALQRFIKKNDVPWPQYFDGLGWSNKFGQQYGIASIPTMWLVDKQGNFREQNAREDLAGKIEKLLAE